MRILLVGEYSRLHNSLKEGLASLGHEVLLVGTGDGFKNFPVDSNVDARWSKSKIPNLFRQLIFRIFKYDFAGLETGWRFGALLPELKGYDVVQLVSETPFQTNLSLEYKLIKKLAAQNKKLFVLSSGVDAVFVKAAVEGKFRYSFLDPYLADKSLVPEYRHALSYLKKSHIEHHKKIYGLADGVIATDCDYMIPLTEEPKFCGLVPNPVNIDRIRVEPVSAGPIVIFLGINRWNYYKKGIPYFEQALAVIAQKYGERVDIITAENLPYDQYIKYYDSASIVLDQVFAYDQGYNALEAMAKGKVVFTGAETEFMRHYGLTERVAINALPNVEKIVAELEFLIENPAEIAAIGRCARSFVESEHHYVRVAGKYLEAWENKR